MRNTPMPAFSIITPTYNRGTLLSRAVRSCINQTVADFELLIIDDCSADNTSEVVALFRDPRIVYDKLNRNKGVNAARNRGLDLARGEYIVFLDSDDELLPEALNIFLKLWSEVKSDRIGNVVTRCIDSVTRNKIGYLEKDNLILEYKEIICAQRKSGEFRSCWKRDVIGGARFEENVFAHESILWGRLAKKWNFLYKDIPTTIYYSNSALSLCSIDSQIKNAVAMARGVEILLTEHADIWKEYCPGKYFSYLMSAIFFNSLAGNKEKVRYWTNVYLKQNLFSVQCWILYILSFVPYALLRFIFRFRERMKNMLKITFTKQQA